ncbi:hypothetical protein PybrP1_002831 [[Pythium] brassicae (nom. inval.)]|nr:hypothetical protein PybrP1_002831 [[Pythium] brassicae (nom. inval.)]
MRSLLEAVTDFLGRYGAEAESTKLTNLLGKLGWEVPANSNLRWRTEIAALRGELDKPDGPDYTLFLEQLIHLYAGVKPPKELSRALFGSKLFLHVLVERFAAVFEGHDSELFKLESDVLCHAGGGYEICLLIRNELFRDEEESSTLGKFMRNFLMVFEDDDPKARWEEFYAIHKINFAAFNRDMKRALWQIDDAVIGKTLLEHMFERDEEPNAPRKRICRAQLENRFRGTADDWRALSVVNSIQLDKDQPRATIEDDEDEIEAGGSDAAAVQTSQADDEESPSNHEPRVWSTRLPFATPAAPTPAAEHPRIATPDDNDSGQASDSTDQSIPVRVKRKRWSPAEVEALKKGYQEFGALPNVWVLIRTKYADVLGQRSNVNLKDKFRNLLLYRHLDASALAPEPAASSVAAAETASE